MIVALTSRVARDVRSETNLSSVLMALRDGAGHEGHVILKNCFRGEKLARILDLDIDKVPHHKKSRSLEIRTRLEQLPANSQVAVSWRIFQGKNLVSHHTRTIPESDLRVGRRRDSFVFDSPASGRYELRAEVFVITLEGVIQAAQSSIKSARFEVE
jgi:hypothetical protein